MYNNVLLNDVGFDFYSGKKMKINLFHVHYYYFLQKLIEKRLENRATELGKMDNEVIVKLENAAIERSRSVESAVFGKYSIWRKEIESENADSTVRLMRDQIIMARVYLSIANVKNKLELYHELQSRLKESQRALGDAISDADLRHRLGDMCNYLLSKYLSAFVRLSLINCYLIDCNHLQGT